MTTQQNNEWGDIPQGWEVVELSQAVIFLDEKRKPIKSNDRFKISGIYPYYGASGIIDYVNDYIFDDDLILLGEDGENILSRNLPLAFRASGKIWVNNHAHVLKPKEHFDIEFLTNFLESLDYSLLNTGTAQPKLNKQTCLKIKVLCPPKPEQTAIATVLSDTDKWIDSLTALIAKKQAIKSATMSQLLSGQKRLPQFANHSDGTPKTYIQTDNGKIPEDWEVVRINEVGEVGRGRVISHNEINRSISDLYPVYSSQTTNNGIMGYLDTFDFVGEYVTWTTDGVNAGKVFYRNGKFNCTNVCGTIKVKENYCAKFIALAMGKEARKYVSTNLANPKLMNGVVKSIQIAIPKSPTEQSAIAQILSDMDSDIIALEHRLTKARALKQGLMHQLLTGKIRLFSGSLNN